jgi:hypothetical protein
MEQLTVWDNFYVIAGASPVLLLFIGIHNAWDNVTYLVLRYSSPERSGQDERGRGELGRD